MLMTAEALSEAILGGWPVVKWNTERERIPLIKQSLGLSVHVYSFHLSLVMYAQ
jgi:hypothetical protein